jgi:uncharacterized membrane protein (Fun14 family)
MERKFKFVIPDHLESIMKESIQKLNGKTFTSHGLGVYECDGQKVALPQEFMVELSDFDAWFENNYPQQSRSGEDGTFYLDMKSLYEWTLENEKLKHPVKIEEQVEADESISVDDLILDVIDRYDHKIEGGVIKINTTALQAIAKESEENHAKRVKPVIDELSGIIVSFEHVLKRRGITTNWESLEKRIENAKQSLKTLDKND